MNSQLNYDDLPYSGFENKNLITFKYYLMKLCAFLIEYEGYQHLIPYSSKALNIFKSMDGQAQNRIIESIANSLQIYEKIVAQGLKLQNSKQVVAGMISSLHLKTNDDAFDRVQDGEILEIYQLDQTQIFRSPKFLAFCSYPIADLYVRTWKELYARPQIITDITTRMIASCLKDKKTIVASVPDYFLMELDSTQKKLFLLGQRVLAPVYNLDGNLAGFLRTLAGHDANRYEDIFSSRSYAYSENSLGNYLKMLREKNNFTVTEVGAYIGNSALYVKELEQNRVLPDGTHIIKLSHLYGVEPSDILNVLTNLYIQEHSSAKLQTYQ